MDFFETVQTRRSIREYQPEPVPRDILEKIVSTGIEAPSGCNMQLRQYIIADDPAVVDQLRPASAAMKGCQAVIVLVMDPKGTKYGEFWVQDASAAMENMLLAAVALGYGSCWIEGALRRCENDLCDILHVPEPLRVWAMMPIGKPVKMPPRPEKSAPADVVHINTFASQEE